MNGAELDEFEFLDAMYRRLSEVRAHRARDEASGRLKKGEHSAFETAEVMIECSIRDYLRMARSGRAPHN